jgi:predicted RNA polymerase sigma factor
VIRAEPIEEALRLGRILADLLRRRPRLPAVRGDLLAKLGRDQEARVEFEHLDPGPAGLQRERYVSATST